MRAKQIRRKNSALFSATLTPDELAHFRKIVPRRHRSGVIRKCLIEAGYLPETETPTAA